MKNSISALFLSLSLAAGWSQAQSSDSGGVRESTDPARAAEVEQKAKEAAGQSTSEAETPSSSGASGTEEKVYQRKKHSTTPKNKKSDNLHKQGNSGSSSNEGSESTGTSGAAGTEQQSVPNESKPYESTPGSSATSGGTSGGASGDTSGNGAATGTQQDSGSMTPPSSVPGTGTSGSGSMGTEPGAASGSSGTSGMDSSSPSGGSMMSPSSNESTDRPRLPSQ